WFAPNNLLEYTRKGRAMAGIYVPFWTFDADTTTRYTGARGEHYYETRMVTVNVNGRSERRAQRVQRTRWYPASGTVSRHFDDVITMASNSLPQRLGNELTPWDFTQAQPYNPDFMAGFQAEGYTISLSDGWDDARSIMARVIERDIRADIGGDAQRIDSATTRYADETFKHILLPIWTAAYKYGGKSYRFLVNGQTGEVQGEGDGCGVLTDIPRTIWTQIMQRIGQPSDLARDPHFFVAHLFLPQQDTEAVVRRIGEIARLRVLQIVYSAHGQTRSEMLGPLARAQEPVFWQLAGYAPARSVQDANARLFEFHLEIERELPVHVVSCSTHSVVYKVRGHVDTLYKYYP
ncbi:MAG: hypothetical protein ACK4SS_09175, partial [Cypionkella sp.]